MNYRVRWLVLKSEGADVGTRPDQTRGSEEQAVSQSHG
jgi:hypothetical protein